jgi:hypothetical protein
MDFSAGGGAINVIINSNSGNIYFSNIPYSAINKYNPNTLVQETVARESAIKLEYDNGLDILYLLTNYGILKYVQNNTVYDFPNISNIYSYYIYSFCLDILNTRNIIICYHDINNSLNKIAFLTYQSTGVYNQTRIFTYSQNITISNSIIFNAQEKNINAPITGIGINLMNSYPKMP